MRQASAVRVARPRKIAPVRGHVPRERPIPWTPAPWGLVQMVEHVPELGEVAGSPSRVYRAERERWPLAERVVVDLVASAGGLQPGPRPHIPAKTKITLEVQLRISRRFVARMGVRRDDRG